LWPSESRPTPGITARAIFFLVFAMRQM
jgi:hypothetical protein